MRICVLVHNPPERKKNGRGRCPTTDRRPRLQRGTISLKDDPYPVTLTPDDDNNILPDLSGSPQPARKSLVDALLAVLAQKQDAPGLSTAHTVPLRQERGMVVTYQGGNLTQIKAPSQSKASPGGGGLRGKIWEFSRGARRRMMEEIFSLNLDAIQLPYFITLTYHESWPEDPAAWKAQLNALEKRIERAWGPVSYYWRLEFQERGAPHFHLLLWLQEPDLREWHPTHRITRLRNNIAWWWNEIAGEGSMKHYDAGTQVKKCESMRHLAGYLSKYVAKPEQFSESCKHPGKLWGRRRPEWLPRNALKRMVEPHQFIALRRILARLSGQRTYSPKPRADGTRQIYGMSCFMREATTNRLLAWLGIIGTEAPG